MSSRLFLSLLTIVGLCASALPATALDPPAAAKEIDAILANDWTANKLEGNPAADDNTFVRRIYLDIIGRIPTTREAEDFLGSKDTGKRAALIDKLLASEGYALHAFNYWADVLRVQSVGIHAAALTGQAYAAYVRQSLRENKPYDQFARELVTAQGKAWENGAVGYYGRDRGMPLDNMATTVRIFIGTRIECAQCHDHPFDKWSQMDFYKMAAFTYGVEMLDYNKGEALDSVHELMHDREREVFQSFKMPVAPQRTKGMSDDEFAALKVKYEAEKKRVDEQRTAAQRVVFDEHRFYQGGFAYLTVSTVRHARSHFLPDATLQLPHDYKYDDAKPNATVEPGTLYGAKATIAPGETRFDAYARWLTHDNARFNSVIADRLWKRAFGLSPIEPLDELTDSTKPMIPELQQRLEKLIVEVGYDMKAFLRVVFNTSAYQRQVTREEIAAGSVYHFTGPILRRMSAEQMWDSFVTLINPSPDLPDEAARDAAQQRVLQGKKMDDSLNALPPEVVYRGIADAGRQYQRVAADVAERQSRIVAARAHAKELNDRARQHAEDASARAAASEASQKVAELTAELAALNSEASRIIIAEIVIPAQKALYQKVTGRPFQSVTVQDDKRAAPVFGGGQVMKDAMLVEMVPIPGYDPQAVPEAERQARDAARRKQFEDEAHYYGIKEQDLPSFFRTREEQGRNWQRAAEIRSPAAPGHYLREFGQSDRETIENANSEASVPQALAMMNGQLLPQIMNRYSQLMLTVGKAATPEEKMDAVYFTLLSRHPTPKEKALWNEAQASGLSTDDLIFSLLNTQQFIFIQ